MMCQKCCKVSGWLYLILGIIFLLVDFGTWDFWGINWWSAVIVLWGLCHVCKANCKECRKMCR
ncbi:MAG: hypothetical protein AABW87_03390 [Nanoarchaeota archaeon]